MITMQTHAAAFCLAIALLLGPSTCRAAAAMTAGAGAGAARGQLDTTPSKQMRH